MGGSPFESLRKVLAGIVGRRHHARVEVHPDRRLADRRSEPRIQIDISVPSSLRPQLIIDAASHDIYDLSTRGMCFRRVTPSVGQDDDLYATGATFRGAVDFQGVRVPLDLEVVNTRADYVGCKITDAPVLWLMELANQVDPVRLGQQLRERSQTEDVQTESSQTESSEGSETGNEGLTLQWFEGGPACDLLVWLDASGTVQRCQMFFLWQVVEWSAAQGVRTGRIDTPPRMGARGGVVRPEITALTSPGDSEAVAFAAKVVASSSLGEAIKAVFAAAASEGPHGPSSA